MSVLAEMFAKLAVAGIPPTEEETFLGEATAVTSTTVTVIPDSSLDGEEVTVQLFGAGSISVGDRVLCLRIPGSGVGCLGKLS